MNMVFCNNKFEINGVKIPEFVLEAGTLIRIYVPNFNFEGKNLGFDLTIALIKRFQQKRNNFPWAKMYNQNSIVALFVPLTVKKYLINKMRVDEESAMKIIEEVGVDINDKFNFLSFTIKKALIIKALFNKNECIILDYYGIDASGIGFLEKLVNAEIEKGKAAIAFDRLEFISENEPFQNIKQIIIKG